MMGPRRISTRQLMPCSTWFLSRRSSRRQPEAWGLERWPTSRLSPASRCSLPSSKDTDAEAALIPAQDRSRILF
jgi:hypothetical protein